MLMSVVKSSCALQKFPSVKMLELEDKIEIEKKNLAKGKDKSKQEPPTIFLILNAFLIDFAYIFSLLLTLEIFRNTRTSFSFRDNVKLGAHLIEKRFSKYLWLQMSFLLACM